MTVHTPHPRSHEHGLADGCPRCAEHAEYPFDGLDEENLTVLVERLTKRLPARSANEAGAMGQVKAIMQKARMLGMTLPVTGRN